jgi:single-strand DNA-binding protein
MILTGIARLGRDVEVRYLGDGTPVANLSLAFNYGKKDSDGRRPTTWVSASLWGERAEKLSEYLLKGTLLSVVCEDVHVEEYDKRDGGKGFNLKARVMKLDFAGGKKDEGERDERPATTATTTTGGGKPAAAPRQGGGGSFDTMDSDIPFNRITDREAMSS